MEFKSIHRFAARLGVSKMPTQRNTKPGNARASPLPQVAVTWSHNHTPWSRGHTSKTHSPVEAKLKSMTYSSFLEKRLLPKLQKYAISFCFEKKLGQRGSSGVLFSIFITLIVRKPRVIIMEELGQGDIDIKTGRRLVITWLCFDLGPFFLGGGFCLVLPTPSGFQLIYSRPHWSWLICLACYCYERDIFGWDPLGELLPTFVPPSFFSALQK